MASQRFGKYLVSEVLGSGGMAEVYAALHPDLDRKVAIKVILPHFATESNFEERFRREARLVASLRHAHIVQIYDFDVVDGRYFMVMEYLEGGTLKDYLAGLKRQKAQMSLAEIVSFTNAITSALDYAHHRGAIHRDIKPANILFTPDREPVLTDFGIAKLLEDAARLTATGGVLGSPFYMPPEQATGGEVDARGDQYALGVMLYEMATGRLPFLGTSAVAVMTQHCNSAPPPPRSLNATLPEAVEAVLLRTLAKRAEDRFASAGELAQALREAVGDGEGKQPGHVLPAAPIVPTVQSATIDAATDAVDDATVIEASIPAGGGSKPNLAETATLTDEATLIGDDPVQPLPVDDEATIITEDIRENSPAAAQKLSTPASQPPDSAWADSARAEIVPVEKEEPQPLAHVPPATLQAANEPNTDLREDIRVPSPPPVPTLPDTTPPKAAPQHFNVGSVQAGIVNQGGEQTFSGDLSFNLNFGAPNQSEAKPATPNATQAATQASSPASNGEGAEFAALLDALRRAFAGSGRVDRFVRLVNQFQTQLDALPDNRANDRKQVVKRVQALLLEMTEATPDPDMVEIMGTSLQRAVQPLAVIDPDLPTLATRITSWVELLVQPE